MASVIPLSRPDITQSEIDAVLEVMRSDRLSMGPRQVRFEQALAERVGRRHGIAVSSGTAGLHLLMVALGIGPGDEVITTPFSFVASANCILYAGARPVFVDICPRSLNMDPKQVEKAITSRTKAILAVEVFGNMRHMEELERLAQAHEIPLIEDACEALGGKRGPRAAGSFGRASVFAFYPNKQITTAEGGMIVTDDDHLAAIVQSLRNQGRAPVAAPPPGASGTTDNRSGHWLAHERLGYNYRLSELASAIGIAQLERLDEMLACRREVAAMYMQRMLDWEDVILPDMHAPEEASWFVFVVRLNDTYAAVERDRIIEGMHRHDIGACNYFPCIHLQPYFREQHGFQPNSFPIAESVSQRTIALPFFNRLDEMSIELVTQTLSIMIRREQLLKR